MTGESLSELRNAMLRDLDRLHQVTLTDGVVLHAGRDGDLWQAANGVVHRYPGQVGTLIPWHRVKEAAMWH